MKTKLCPSLFLAAALAVFVSPLRALAQGNTVTISAAEFQRMVYSAHLLTQLDEKPELDASLQVLLEIDRRNPNADPDLLAGVLREATGRYRANAPSYIRARGSRDEILAAYLDALRQVFARTNFVPANLSLLHALITRSQPPTSEPQADLIHSGSQSLLGSEGDLTQRQALLDACVARAQGRASFRAAMDGLLLSETLVSVGNSPGEIIGNTNSPLHGNLTMQTLLALSASSGNGSVTVSSNQLMALFSDETQTFWDTINTNLAVQIEINRNQPDLLAYLTNQAAIDADAQRLAAVKQGQVRRIASATAAVLVQSKLMQAKEPLIKLSGQMRGCVEGLHKITDGLAAFAEKDATKLAKVAASGNMLAGAMEIFNLFLGGESPEEQIAREVGNIKTLIGDLSTNMNYRFDRVDQSLTQIYQTLNEQFAHLGGDVDAIRLALLDVQTSLFRIERNLATFHALDWRFDLLEDMNLALSYEARVGNPMAYDLFLPSYVGMENVFYTHAYNRAASETLSRYTTLPFGDEYFYSQLSPDGATNVYAEALNYIKKCLRQRLGLAASFPEQPVLANPQDWSAGAAAWLQLAVENPGHFRRYERDVGFPGRLDGIISKGRELTNFFRSLTFGGTNINWPLYDGVESFYLGKLSNFIDQVRSTEQQYASGHGFAVDMWRQWSRTVPRIATSDTTVIQTVGQYSYPIPPAAQSNVLAISAGLYHNLVLKPDGTVIGWGENPHGEASGAPAGNNNVAIAAGWYHNLALKADGTVVGWGQNNYGQANGATAGNNVIAIAAGYGFSVALKADGTIVAWGDVPYVPPALTNAVAIAAGNNFILGLRADGTAVDAGRSVSNVVAIAAGGYHRLALRADSTVVGWGTDLGYGVTNGAVAGSNVVAIAAGYFLSLALRADGTVVAWGFNGYGQTNVPPSATNVIAMAGGGAHSLLLAAAGAATTGGEGAQFLTRAQIPGRVGNLFEGANRLVLTNLDLNLNAAGIELGGAKALFQAVLELGMPYTLERDDVLHGFLYGSESLVDLEASRAFLADENSRLAGRPDAKPQMLSEVAALRYLRFAERLEARLNDLAATGQPEIPRSVGHTLRLLSLLRDAWATVPPPALEIGRETNACSVVLYGEPYAHYTLQYRDTLSQTGWNITSITNLHNEQMITLPASEPQRFYRSMLPVP